MQQEPGRRGGKWFADPSDPDEMSLVFTNSQGSAFASAVTTHAAAESLTMTSSMRTIDGNSAPTHLLQDQSRGETLAEAQYTWDDADDRARVNVVEYPERPHRRRTRTLHPEGSMVTAGVSGLGSMTSSYGDWSFVSERDRL